MKIPTLICCMLMVQLMSIPAHADQGDAGRTALATDSSESDVRLLGMIFDDRDSSRGLRVIGLSPSGPASEAGIQRGDYLLELDGVSLIDATVSDLIAVLRGSRSDQPIRLKFQRSGDELSTMLPLATDAVPAGRSAEVSGLPATAVRGLDAELMANHDGLVGYFGTGDGVVVLRVASENAWGLQPGDVILTINGMTMQKPADIWRQMVHAETLQIKIMRDGELLFLDVQALPQDVIADDACTRSNIPPTTPSSDFILVGDGDVVRHLATNLEWRRCLEGQTWDGDECRGRPRYFNWATAQEHAANQSDGWRVPRIEELKTIVEHCRGFPSINRQVFPGSASARAWSSSVRDDRMDQVWSLSFQRGILVWGERFDGNVVRLVRDTESMHEQPSDPD